MIKRELVKFLENKHEEAVSKARDEYRALRMQAKQEFCHNLGCDQAAAQIQELFDKAHDIWSAWKLKCESVECISFTNGYYGLDSILYRYIGENKSVYKMVLNDELCVNTSETKRAEDAGNELLKNINESYTNVIATVQSLKTTKEAAAYLKELGFDLSELENPPGPVTALAVQIDTSYLFINKDAA